MTLTLKAFDASIELDLQRNLFKICFPETVDQPLSSRKYYTWKFHSSMEPQSSYEYTAITPEGTMAGYYAALPLAYKIGTQIFTCGLVCDVMTSPAMRGQGIFTALGKYSLDCLEKAGLDFTLGYPIRPEVIPGHLKVGWKIAFDLPMYLYPLKADGLLASRRLAWASPLGRIAVFFWRKLFSIAHLTTSAPAYETYTLEELLDLPDFDRFLAAWTQRTPNALIKSKDFFRWRLGSPEAEYKAICIRDPAHRIVQVAIVRATVLHGVPSLCILDWMVTERDRRYSLASQTSFSDLARQHACEVIVTMMSQTCAKAHSLAWLGYVKTPAIFRLIIKTLREYPPAEELYAEERWSLMWIDSDDL